MQEAASAAATTGQTSQNIPGSGRADLARDSSEASDEQTEWGDEDQNPDHVTITQKLEKEGIVTGFKHRLGRILESAFVELAIVMLIFTDVGIISAEYGIENQLVCIGGLGIVQMPPKELKREIAVGVAAHAKMHETGEEHAHLFETAMHRQLSGGRLVEPPSRSLLQSAFDVVYRSSSSGSGEGVSSGGGNNPPAESATSATVDNPSDVIKNVVDETTVIPTTSLICEGSHGDTVHKVAHSCHLASICILSIFFVELLLKMWVHPWHFLSNKMHVVDLMVVTLSLILDIFLTQIVSFFISHEGVINGVDFASAILIVFRLWRVMRVFHGMFETAHKAYNRFSKLSKEIKGLKLQIKETNEKADAATKERKALGKNNSRKKTD